MSPTPDTTATDRKRPPRRLPYEARRAQLVELAAPLVAEQGLTEFALDDVAARADVTRNLLYHYFPRGRRDIIVAVAEWAGDQLTEGWVVDESVPLEQRMATNFLRFFGHAMEPTVAWRLNRLARSAGDPEIERPRLRRVLAHPAHEHRIDPRRFERRGVPVAAVDEPHAGRGVQQLHRVAAGELALELDVHGNRMADIYRHSNAGRAHGQLGCMEDLPALTDELPFLGGVAGALKS